MQAHELFDTRPLKHLLPLHNRIPKANQEHCPTRPQFRGLVMRRDLRLEATPVTDTLDDAGNIGSAVEHAHIAGRADICVDHWVVIGDHVFVGSVRGHGVLEGICGAAEEEAPEGAVDQVQQGYDAEGSVWG